MDSTIFPAELLVSRLCPFVHDGTADAFDGGGTAYLHWVSFIKIFSLTSDPWALSTERSKGEIGRTASLVLNSFTVFLMENLNLFSDDS